MHGSIQQGGLTDEEAHEEATQRTQQAFAGRDEERNVAAGVETTAVNALVQDVVAGDVLLCNCTAVSTHNVVGAVAVVNILVVLVQVLASSLRGTAASASVFTLVVDVSHSVDHGIALIANIRAGAILVVHSVLLHMLANSAALLALAINVGAGNILAHNSLAVSAQNIVGVVVVGRKLELLTHVVANETAASTSSFTLIVDVSHSVNHGMAGVADIRAGAIAIVLSGLIHMLTNSAAASTSSFAIVVDVRLSVDHSMAVVANIRAGAVAIVLSALIHMLANSAAASTSSFTIVVDVSLSVNHGIAVFADIRAGAIAIVLSALIHMLANSAAASTSSFTIVVDVSLSVDHGIAVFADIRAGAITVVHRDLIHMVARLLSGISIVAFLALAINIGAAKLVHNFLAILAENLVGAMTGALVFLAGIVAARSAAESTSGFAIVVDVSLSANHGIAVFADIRAGAVTVVHTTLINMLASGLRGAAESTSGFAIVVDVILSADYLMAGVADIRAGAVTIVHRALIHMLTSRIRSVTFRALAIHKHAARLIIQSYMAIVADFLMSAAVAVTHIGHVIVETARGRLDMSGVIISRKCRRNHRKRHSTRYNKRQQTAYFFHFHKPDLLYKTIRYFLFF